MDQFFAFDDNMVNYLSNYKVDEDNHFSEFMIKNFWFQKENILLVKSASQKLRDFINGKDLSNKLLIWINLPKFLQLLMRLILCTL